ncbi:MULTISPECIES: hypothetical protein [Methylobacterium]|uniref:hypothetical protein n=1 Tax=Methylobacterium TaxID=407 RepID=UPI0013E9E1F1|nr:hypothetical protein [Methylobacterium sp. DB0501]NGM32927.1 hypothetical protein [Methylobacterium sp. DB0501]
MPVVEGGMSGCGVLLSIATTARLSKRFRGKNGHGLQDESFNRDEALPNGGCDGPAAGKT